MHHPKCYLPANPHLLTYILNSSFNLDGKAFGNGNMPGPGATAVLSNPISFCEGEEYSISFYARQPFPEAQHCVIEIGWLDSNYAIVQTPQLTSTWKHFGPTEFQSVQGVQDGVVRNADGSYAANLQILVSCYGIKGVAPPPKVQIDIDSLIIIPA